MGYFPTVSKGDKVHLTAEFHNAVVRTVNAVMGNRAKGIAPLSRTRTTIPICATEDIDGGSPVELVAQGDFDWGTRAYLARQARTQAAAIGIARDFIKEDNTGSMTVFGLELVTIPDNSTGAYVTMKADSNGKMVFTRTDTATQYLLIDTMETVAGSKQVGHIVWAPLVSAPTPNTNAFHAELVGWDDEAKTYTIKWLGGTAQCFGELPVMLAAGKRTNISENTLAYLFYDPSETPKWEFRLDTEDGSPGAVVPQLDVPLWHFTYANDGTGYLTQDFEGGVMVPRLRNALDTESAS